MPVHGSQRFEQVSMTATGGDVYGPLAMGILVGAPSARPDQDTVPIAGLGGVGQRLARGRGFLGQCSRLGDSVPDDVHVDPDVLVVLSSSSRRTSSEVSADQPYAAVTAASRASCVRPAASAIAPADFAGDDGGPDGLLGAPVGRVHRRAPQEGEYGRDFDGEVGGEAFAIEAVKLRCFGARSYNRRRHTPGIIC